MGLLKSISKWLKQYNILNQKPVDCEPNLIIAIETTEPPAKKASYGEFGDIFVNKLEP